VRAMIKRESLTIFVLKLKDEKYYVGTTSNLPETIGNIFLNRGPEWTQLHAIEKLVYESPLKSPWEEDAKVKECMLEHGIDNVRGGSYSAVKLTENEEDILCREISRVLLAEVSSASLKQTDNKEESPLSEEDGDDDSKQYPQVDPKLSEKKYFKEPEAKSSHLSKLLPSANPIPSFFVSAIVPPTSAAASATGMLCSRCGRNSHNVSSCFAKTSLSGQALSDKAPCPIPSSNSNSDGDRCFRCGRKGHWASECYSRSSYYDYWDD